MIYTFRMSISLLNILLGAYAESNRGLPRSRETEPAGKGIDVCESEEKTDLNLRDLRQG